MSFKEALIGFPQRVDDQASNSAQPHQPSGAVAETPVFHRFLDLPGELQMQIWSHAAGRMKLRCGYVWQEHKNMLSPYLPPYSNPVEFKFALKEKGIVRRRGSLTATCRLSRMISLEAWRVEISEIWITGTHANESFSERRSTLVTILDGLINMVKSYMEGKEVNVLQMRAMEWMGELGPTPQRLVLADDSRISWPDTILSWTS